MDESRRPRSDKGKKKEKKTRLGSVKNRRRKESRYKTSRESQKIWSKIECDLLCAPRNENNEKKKELRYQERNKEERIKYYRNLRELVKKYGSRSRVYIDESGFEEVETSIYAWSKKGKKVYGERQGKRSKRKNLVAGRRKKEKDLIAPMLFTGSLDAVGFESWLSQFLIPSLTKPSILIMDNAPIHRKAIIRKIGEEAGHGVIFLPKYSPDLNDIEHDFSALKRARMYAKAGTSLEQIIRDYCIT